MGIFRSAEAINGFKSGASAVFETITDPWRRGFSYATQEGEKNARGLVDAMFSSDTGKDALTNISHKWKDADDAEHVMNLNGGKMATSVAGLAIGYRALSGGGLYRNKDGETDIAGIPFV